MELIYPNGELVEMELIYPNGELVQMELIYPNGELACTCSIAPRAHFKQTLHMRHVRACTRSNILDPRHPSTCLHTRSEDLFVLPLYGPESEQAHLRPTMQLRAHASA